MSQIYAIAGLSRQAHQQQNHAQAEAHLACQWVIGQVLQVRMLHPVMGLRKIYWLLLRQAQAHGWDMPMGRDRFIAIGVAANLSVSLPKSSTRTTYSLKSLRYDNLLVDRQLTDINQLWVSDITYVRIGDRFEYLSMVMDVYSRRILGYDLSPSLSAEGALRALQMALKARGKTTFEHQLIHHSDRGIQYLSNRYTNLLDTYKVRISLGYSAYENAHMERLNGSIKNEYILPMQPNSFDQLQQWLPKIMERYNTLRPHWELDAYTPTQWELRLKNLPESQRTKLSIFVEHTTKDRQKRFSNQPTLFSNPPL
jgi:hypothetical protein